MKSSTFVALLTAATLVCLTADAVFAATPTSTSILLRRRAQPSGPATFDIVLLGASADQTVTSPGGHVFAGFLPSFTGLTESQALAETMGQWTIARPPLIPPGQPAENYTFSVAPYSLSSFYTVPPQITSPADNSIVPAHFPLAFAWPPGETPPTNRVANSSFSTQIASVSLGVTIGSNVAPIDVAFKPGETQGTLQLAIGTLNDMKSYLSAVTPSAPNPYWSYAVGMTFYNLSQRISLTVTNVPEPACLALLGSAALLTGFRRRKKCIDN